MTPRKVLRTLLAQRRAKKALAKKTPARMPTIYENDEGVQLDVQSVTDDLFLPVDAQRPLHRVVEADEETRPQRIRMENHASEISLTFQVFASYDPSQHRSSSEEEEAHAFSRSRKSLLSAMTPLIPERNRTSPKPEKTCRTSSMEDYYGAFESRIGLRIMLGGRKHFGYYSRDTFWPFPIKKALRAMEDRLIASLDIQPGGGLILDAGCGEGYVAMHLARNYQMRVHCIDIVERHVLQTERNITKSKLEQSVTVEQMDYHNLNGVSAQTFDGIFAMETLRHAQNPNAVLRELFRLLKMDGTLVLHELARSNTMSCPCDFKEAAKAFISLNHIDIVREATLKQMAEREGFKDVVIEDISIHIMPLLRLFFTMAYIPAFFIRQCGLEETFINQTSAVTLYRGIKMGYWKYLVIKGKRPGIPNPWELPNRYI